ncbi:two-component regulator propeller domain-containing protein [Pseudopedobacter beijingensis]|uniref:histidine kinase n=1 Tax=Pseudopedobacter beijingensis TaxID=1207056 RepID=A0ABW4IFE5_9SPHI
MKKIDLFFKIQHFFVEKGQLSKRDRRFFKSKGLFCVLLFLLFHDFIKAQKPDNSFEHFNVEQGLSQASVLSVTQDNRGFMWIGTRYGLNRYDGYRFKNFYADGKKGDLSGNEIMALLSDNKHNLWIGTTAGLNLYRPNTNDFDEFKADPFNPKSLSSSAVSCLFQDSRGSVWIGTYNGLNRLIDFKTKSFEKIDISEGENGFKSIRCIYETKDKTLWVGTTSGLVTIAFNGRQYEKNSIKKYIVSGTEGSISNNTVTSIIEDRKKRIWVGTQSGLNLFDPSTGKFTVFKKTEEPNSIISNNIRKMLMDDMGYIWIGTLEGLSVMDPDQLKFYNLNQNMETRNGLSQNSIHSMYKDRSGSTWVGTYFGGVNVHHPSTTFFKNFQHKENEPSLSDNVVSSILEDDKHNLWIATEGGGLNYYDRKSKSFICYKHDPYRETSIGSNLIKILLPEGEDVLWIGTHGGGINRFDRRTGIFKRLLSSVQEQEMIGLQVTSLIHFDNKRLLIGTQRGLFISDESKSNFYNFDIKIPEEAASIQIKALYKANNGDIWVGTNENAYLLKANSRTLIPISTLTKMSDLRVRANFITSDSHHNIWIGTYYKGLVKYDTKHQKITNYTKEQGLPHDNVVGLIEDQTGILWISTSNGLSSFSSKTQHFKNYNTSDGLLNNTFNVNAVTRTYSGDLFFGGYNGFTRVIPHNIKENTYRAPVYFTGLEISNKPVPILDSTGILEQDLSLLPDIELSYKQNTFKVDFALLNFIKSNKNSYIYKLDGFEQVWHQSNIPQASYINVPPGKYTLLVKGYNNDGYTENVPKELKIVITPPFYQSGWAYLLYSILFIAVLYLFFRYLLINALFRKEQETNQLKLNFFTNISHEIRTPLTLITGPLDQLLQKDYKDSYLEKQLRTIKLNTDRLMELVTELLDFRKIEEGKMKLELTKTNLSDFCQEVFLVFKPLAESRAIYYHFDSDCQELEIAFDRSKMEKVLFNILSNAFKFTEDNGQIAFRVVNLDKEVAIYIADNGKGIAEEDHQKIFENFYQSDNTRNHSSGIGLAFSKSIVLLHGGKIGVKKNGYENMDTCFEIIIPKNLVGGNDLQNQGIKSEAFLTQHILAGIQKETLPEKELVEGNLETILIVEDNEEIRQLIVSVLAGKYNVLQAGDGKIGWELAKKELPDLIISDVMMPEMDGLELCSLVKSEESTSHIPVILLTARAASIHQIDGLETGADAYVTKPFDIKVLELTMRNILTSKEKLRRKYSKDVFIETHQLTANNRDRLFLEKVIAFVDKYLSSSELSVPMLTSEIGMSQPVLNKKLKSLTGMGANDYIKSIRLKRAAQLLKETKMPVSEIAYATGFNERKYFSQEFKKQFGVSPTDYSSSEEN